METAMMEFLISISIILSATFVLCMAVSSDSGKNHCGVDAIVGKYYYMRAQPNYSEAFALRFDMEDNLFVISASDDVQDLTPIQRSALDDLEDLTHIQVSVIEKENPRVIKKVKIEPEAYPEALDVDKNGRVLVATDNGLYIYDNTTNEIMLHKFENITLLDITVGPRNEVFVVKKHEHTVNLISGSSLVPYYNLTSDFNLYVDVGYSVFGDDGLYSWHFTNQTFEEVDIKGTMAFTDMTTDKEGNIYAVNERGLWLRSHDSHNFVRAKGVGNPSSSVAVDSFGNIAIGEEEFILRLSKMGLIATLGEECGTNLTLIQCFMCDIPYE